MIALVRDSVKDNLPCCNGRIFPMSDDGQGMELEVKDKKILMQVGSLFRPRIIRCKDCSQLWRERSGSHPSFCTRALPHPPHSSLFDNFPRTLDIIPFPLQAVALHKGHMSHCFDGNKIILSPSNLCIVHSGYLDQKIIEIEYKY